MSRRLAYAVSRFPLITETFILREILALQAHGRSVDLYAIIHQRGALRHPEAERLEAVAHYLSTVSGRTLKANARMVASAPQRYAGLLANVVASNWPSVDFLTKGLWIFPGAIELAERMRRRNVGHIHAHFGTHPALFALLAAEANQIGFSFTVHAVDLFVDTTMLAEKVRRARFVVAISDYNRQRLIEIAGPQYEQKIHVIRCGVDLAEYPFTRHTREREDLRILAVGSLRDYKGHDRLIRACALLQRAEPSLPFTCDIIGDGPLREGLKQLTAELGLEQRVRLRGAQDQHEVRRAMQEADLLVLPSVVAPNGLMEGIPVVLMEALALGLPAIATSLSGIPELVRDGETGRLVAPDGPGALCEAMVEFARDPASAGARAVNARRLVEQDYDLAQNVIRLDDLFTQQLGDRAAEQVSSRT